MNPISQTREYLRIKFENGARPSQQDFADLFESFLSKTEDGVLIDNDGVARFSKGMRLGDTDNAQLGTMRFHNGTVEIFNGAWVGIATGSGGAFQPVGATTNVAFGTGNVGIGTFDASKPVAYRLEIDLGPNSAATDQVRFGNVVCSNGSSPFHGYANFSHRDCTSNVKFGLRQGPNGNVQINAPTGQSITLRHDGSNQKVRLGITETGNVVVGSGADIAPAGQYVFQVSGDAYKSQGGDTWKTVSDVRVKDDIRDLDVGLEQLLRVRPVRFRYNGMAGTGKGEPGIGVIGQEIEQIFPEMVQRAGANDDIEDLRIYNGSALTYILVNAVKQLANQVRELEQAIAKSKTNPAESTPNAMGE